MDENKLIPVCNYKSNFLASLIKSTGSPCLGNNFIYVCKSPTFCISPIHDFVLSKRDWSKKIGDTCRMWVKFYEDVDASLFYCWEGFYIKPERLSDGRYLIKGRQITIDGIATGEHTTKLVLTEKVRFRQ